MMMPVKITFICAYLFGALWLLGWEIAAFFVSTKYTISELWWQVEGTGWTAARYGTVAALTWTTLHLAFAWFR